MQFAYDILAEILCRLPVKTLLRFRALSKTCCRLIESPDFINLHLNQSIKTRTNRSLIIDDIKPMGSIYAVDLDSPDRSLVELDRPYKAYLSTIEYGQEDGVSFVRPRKLSTDVFGCCNGLLAMRNNQGLISLWNPSTKKHQILPKFWGKIGGCDRILKGFGYDGSSDDYKVILIIQPFEEQQARVMIYSLKANSSRRIDYLPDHSIGDYNKPGVFVGSSLHWVFQLSKEHEYRELILGFDLGDEKFKMVPLPDFGNPLKFFIYVAELGGSLSVSCDNFDKHVDIWIMKEYGVKESWMKLFSVSKKEYGMYEPLSYIKPLCYSKAGDKVLLDSQSWGSILLYDLEEKEIKRIKISESLECKDHGKISANICMRSLVPLNVNAGSTGSSKQQVHRTT